MVEHLVGYAKRDLMIPQLPFDDHRTANEAAAVWCAEVNATTHSEICAVPAERLTVERPLLGSAAVLALQAHQKIEGIIAGNAIMAMGAYAALKAPEETEIVGWVSTADPTWSRPSSTVASRPRCSSRPAAVPPVESPAYAPGVRVVIGAADRRTHHRIGCVRGGRRAANPCRRDRCSRHR